MGPDRIPCCSSDGQERPRTNRQSADALDERGALGLERGRRRTALAVSLRADEAARWRERLSPPCSLLKQLRRKLGEIIPPVDPRVRARALLELHVEAVLLQHLDGRLRVRDQAIVHARTKPGELRAFISQFPA